MVALASLKERLGFTETRDLSMAAPFDYRSQALLYIADDMPEPNQPGYQKAVEEAVVDLARGVGGRTLVLFTSHQALQTTYRAIKPELERHGIAVLAQRHRWRAPALGRTNANGWAGGRARRRDVLGGR